MDLAEPLDDQSVAPPPLSDPAHEMDRRETMARGVFRAIAAAAALAIIVAAVLNWLWITQYAPVPRSVETVLRGGSIEDALAARPVDSASAVNKLAPVIIGYETTARHAVPGATRGKGEAIYRSLDMDVEVQVAISTYASVEMFASETAARERVREIMTLYPVRQENSLVASVTPAVTGFTENEGARAIVWVRDSYVTLIKTMYGRGIPAQRRDFLKNVGAPVATATDIYQRTGKSGVEVGKVQ